MKPKLLKCFLNVDLFFYFTLKAVRITLTNIKINGKLKALQDLTVDYVLLILL